MKQLEKSYKGFIIWMIGMIVFMFVPVLFDDPSLKLSILYIMNEMFVSMAVLTMMVEKNEKIYWYTGMMYEDALKATSMQRIAYAKAHRVKFVKAMIVSFVYSIISIVLGFHYGFDIAFEVIAISVAAISTMFITL